MSISVNIQSYKRAGKVETLDIVPSANLWVHEFEVDEYKLAYPEAKIMVLPDDTRGNLPRVKNFILEAQKNDRAVLFLDDDMSYVGYWYHKGQYKIESERQFMAMLEKYTLIAEEWGAKLWGINVNPDKQVYREYSPFSTQSYISSSFACFLNGCVLRYDENLPLKEDYDMTLQQLNTYRRMLRVNGYFYSKKSASNVGGCATYRNLDREREQLLLLQKKWGADLVKFDTGESRSHSSTKKRAMDINPIVRSPIKGI